MNTVKYKYICVGCWNNLNDLNNIYKLDDVTNNIKTYLKNETNDDKTQQIIILGDNYYPNKIQEDNKKKKIIFPDKLALGFTKLPEDIEISMIMGNHDFETNKTTKKNLFLNENNIITEEQSDCKIVKLELAAVKNTNISLDLFKSQYLIELKTLLLSIDTSIYSADAEDFLICYNEFLTKNNLFFNSVKELENYQNDFIFRSIIDVLRSNNVIENIIIMGHHPIIGVKTKQKIKDGKLKEKTEVLDDIPLFINVLQEIYNLLPDATYNYLCADYHSYQYGIIDINFDNNKIMKINQYIIGIGGAELDITLNEKFLNKRYENNNISYELLNNINNWGFMVCRIEKNTENKVNVIFDTIFIEKEDSLMIGGYKKRKNKTKKYKNKNKKRKNKTKKYKNKNKKRKNKTKKYKK